jgi:hypothetical protein
MMINLCPSGAATLFAIALLAAGQVRLVLSGKYVRSLTVLIEFLPYSHSSRTSC